ncbi:MAG TPA: hypothetical protein VFU05_03775 [Cyclobacteriaceae bacterium]|nr:hypothetical protein [Cyclobacteriaceae bacterium]
MLITLHANIRELEERKNFAEPEELGHIDGKLMAYIEMLAIVRSSSEEFGVRREDVGL